MRKIFILLTFLVTINSVNAQIPIGVKYDINGIPLNGYFDPIIYSPDKKISKVHNSDSYEVGYYYDSLGNKIDGLIKFENDKIYFMKKEEDSRIKIKPNEIRHFVIGVDSFFVIDKFHFKNRIKEKPEFVQYITEFNDHTYAKHYHFTSEISQYYVMQPPIIETFMVKHNDSLIWDNFPDKNTFKERALKYFNHIPYLKDKIISGEYHSENMLSVIKMAEYFDKYNKSKAIFYDKYWQEVRGSDKATYTAIISDKVDSIWTFEYYKDNMKIYKGSYSSFYPNTKNGDFIAYYPNGQTRQIVSFSNNKPKEVKTFSDNGLLKTNYKIIENEYVFETDTDIKYLTVNDSTGKNILKSNNSSVLQLYDDVSGFQYNSTFKLEELSSVQRILGNVNVFQITNPDYDFKIKSLQRKFNTFMSEKKYDNALSENAQGIILVYFLLDNKGKIMESNLLNKIHPEIDDLVQSFLKTNLKFRPYKINKEKKYCEVVIPFEFSVNRFYRAPVNYNHFHHMNFHNQMMHHNYRPTIPTRMPTGF